MGSEEREEREDCGRVRAWLQGGSGKVWLVQPGGGWSWAVVAALVSLPLSQRRQLLACLGGLSLGGKSEPVPPSSGPQTCFQLPGCFLGSVLCVAGVPRPLATPGLSNPSAPLSCSHPPPKPSHTKAMSQVLSTGHPEGSTNQEEVVGQRTGTAQMSCGGAGQATLLGKYEGQTSETLPWACRAGRSSPSSANPCSAPSGPASRMLCQCPALPGPLTSNGTFTSTSVRCSPGRQAAPGSPPAFHRAKAQREHAPGSQR